MTKGTAILPLLILIDLNTKIHEKNNSIYATFLSKLFIHKKPKAMKTKINLLPLLWVLLIPLTTALCQNKSAPPKDNAKTKYSCYQENIDKKNKNFLGDFSNVTGWIVRPHASYAFKVPRPFALVVDEDQIITRRLLDTVHITMELRTLPVFRCSGNVFSESDIGKRATISGKFFYKDCNGEKFLFYDEGDGNPPFTYFNRPKH
ncbi:MAG: hypothetical protein CRN43_11360 [Candidatus Nephrothrix sp. EaCA]|nr:MAG: hypothetical protein CRN43_11360 [Candidatus Nephrothrix sp. EaCA]